MKLPHESPHDYYLRLASVNDCREIEDTESEDRDDLIDDGRSDGYGESYAERNV